MKIVHYLGATKNIKQIENILFCKYWELIKGLPETQYNRESILQEVRRWIYLDAGTAFRVIPLVRDEHAAVVLGRGAAGSVAYSIEELARRIKEETEEYAQ